MKKTSKKPKKNLNSLIIPNDINVLISSMGGVGTTFFINHISKYRSTNLANDRDKFKHLFFPPFSQNKNIKYIYLFGNPIDAVISLFNNKRHHNHSQKFLSYNKNLKSIKKESTLEKYVAGGVDRFLFAEQFNNWINGSVFYPTLFIKYEKLWDNIDKIYDFLDIPSEEIKSFPARKKRSSDFTILENDTQESLNKIYGDFKNYIDAFDDCLIVNNQKKNLIPGMFFTKTFYYTLRRIIGIKINFFC